MPIDPSIITSGNQMAPVRLPDVNAMMQTQTKGLENIYTLERQRAADAAAAQAQDQAALTEALAPAFSTAYRDPSDSGIDSALALVPDQFRAEMAAQAAKLKAIPTREGRMAAIEASLAGSDIGKAILDRVMTPYQAGTLDLQRQQQELAKQRLAFEQQQAQQPPQMTPYQSEMLKLQQAKDAREAGKVSPEMAKQQQTAKDVDLAISEINAAAEPGGLIDMSTGSTIGNILDSIVAQGSGGMVTLPGDIAAAQMEVVAHLARMAVPRFEGPQSEYDAKLYERASGALADPTVSASTKRAAADTLIRILSKRRDQFAALGAAPTGGASQNENMFQYDADGNLIE